MTSGYLTNRFVKALKGKDIGFRFTSLGKYSGVYLSGVIFVDHAKGDVLATVVHELLHHLYEKKPHRWIYKMEKWWVKKSSWKMKKKVLQEFLDRT